MLSPTFEPSTYSAIANWYAQQKILVTGGTGFLGKVFIVKLLLSCPEVGKIYILIRPKKGKEPKERLLNYLNGKIFDIIRQTDTNLLNKITPITGDINEPGLGLSIADRIKIIEDVSIIFNSAATIRFDETLSRAVKTNVFATKKMLELAYEIKHLKAFIHVSTAYSNCPYPEIEERVYDLPIDVDKILQIVDLLDEGMVEYLKPKIMEGWPNTYNFSKAVAENLISNHSKHLPIAILRPSIIAPAWAEPFAGWVDCLHGCTGVFLAVSKGVLRTIICNRKCNTNLIPVDFVANSMVVLGHHISTQTYNEVPVFHCTADRNNPKTWKDVEDLYWKYSKKYPMSQLMWFPTYYLTNNVLIFKIMRFLRDELPAQIADFISSFFGKNTQFSRMQQKLKHAQQLQDYFFQNQWDFHNGKLKRICDKLSNKDKEIFFCDESVMDWDIYFKNYVLGIKKFILNENMEAFEENRKNYNKFQTIHYVFLSIIFVFIASLCYYSFYWLKTLF